MCELTDVDKYPTFLLRNGRLEPVELWEVAEMRFYKPHEWHHFLPKTMRKNNPKKYSELEYLQKMILLERDFHRSLPGMEAKNVFSKTGVRKEELIYLE